MSFLYRLIGDLLIKKGTLDDAFSKAFAIFVMRFLTKNDKTSRHVQNRHEEQTMKSRASCRGDRLVSS